MVASDCQYMDWMVRGCFGLTDNRCRHDNAADTKTCQNEQAPELVQIISPGNCEGSTACRHQDRGGNEKFPVVAPEDR
jgi:hypothetical protein